MGLLLEPSDAEPPILNPDVRATAYAWIHEQNAAEELRAVRVEPRRSVLLYGPPGTGKTTLAHHLCARVGMQMLLVSPHDIESKYLGESEGKIAKLFRAVERVADQVAIFFDEIDGMCPKRRDSSSADRSYTSNLITFMRMLDFFPGIVFAATNRVDAIDTAFLRRIEMKVPVLVPDKDCRRAIIERYLSPMVMTAAAIDALTNLLAGASPALIRQLMEALKRDLVMAIKLDQPSDAAAVFGRLRASVQAPDSETPIPFWDASGVMKKLSDIQWPPTWPESEEA